MYLRWNGKKKRWIGVHVTNDDYHIIEHQQHVTGKYLIDLKYFSKLIKLDFFFFFFLSRLYLLDLFKFWGIHSVLEFLLVWQIHSFMEIWGRISTRETIKGISPYSSVSQSVVHRLLVPISPDLGVSCWKYKSSEYCLQWGLWESQRESGNLHFKIKFLD